MIMNEWTSKVPARSIREADAVFANSRYVAETVRSRFGIEAGTIHNGDRPPILFSARTRIGSAKS